MIKTHYRMFVSGARGRLRCQSGPFWLVPRKVASVAPLRGLFPRHLRAANASVFVHAPIRPQTAPVQAGKGKKPVKKIVQNCALLCSVKSPLRRLFLRAGIRFFFAPVRKRISASHQSFRFLARTDSPRCGSLIRACGERYCHSCFFRYQAAVSAL